MAESIYGSLLILTIVTFQTSSKVQFQLERQKQRQSPILNMGTTFAAATVGTRIRIWVLLYFCFTFPSHVWLGCLCLNFLSSQPDPHRNHQVKSNLWRKSVFCTIFCKPHLSSRHIVHKITVWIATQFLICVKMCGLWMKHFLTNIP